MLSPSTPFLFLLASIFLLLLLVNLSQQQMFTDWETGMWEKNPAKFRVYTDPHGQININGWVQNKKPVSFPLFFKNPKQSAGGPKNPLYFDMKICPMPGKKCDNGFTLCFVGQLDPRNNGVSRTFELKNAEKNQIGERCNELGIWSGWKRMEGGKKEMHGLLIQPNEKGDSWDVSASYCKVEEENSNDDMRMKRNLGRGDGGCYILRFNNGSSIGGSWVSGGKVKDMSNDFRRRVHNGAMLDQQHAVFSLPLDVLSKFNPANDLFGVVGSQDCGITITFEGDNLKRCIKPEDCPHHTTPTKTTCEVYYQEAEPAQIKDKMQQTKGGPAKRFKRGLLEKDGPEARYVQVGLLKKPVEDSEHKYNFRALQDAAFMDKDHKQNKAELKPYIADLLASDSRFRTLGATAVFDYWKLDESIKEPVMKVTKCSGGAELMLLSDVFDKKQKPPTVKDKKLPFSEDFAMFEKCCMINKKVDQSLSSSLDEIKEASDWPDLFGARFDKEFRVKTGLNQPLAQDQKMAALFEYSLSPYANANRDTKFGRGNYLSDGNAEPKSFTKGHLFGPPKLAIREQEIYKVKIDLHPKPKAEELDKWKIDGKQKVLLAVEQPVVQCGCEGGKSPEGAEAGKHLQMGLPILVAFPAKELANGKYERIGHATLESHFTVLPDGRKVQVPVAEEGLISRKAYDEMWWSKLLMAKEQKQMEMKMGQLNKKGAENDERDEDDGDTVDRDDEYEQDDDDDEDE